MDMGEVSMSEEKSTPKELMYSPLKRWRREHCEQCGDECNPSERRMLSCILCDLSDTIRRASSVAKQEGAPY